MNHPLPWLLASNLLLGMGCLCIEITKTTRGVGSWRCDNELRILAGACWGYSLLCLAWGILAAIN